MQSELPAPATRAPADGAEPDFTMRLILILTWLIFIGVFALGEPQKQHNNHQAEGAQVYDVRILSQPRDNWFIASVVVNIIGVGISLGVLFAIWSQSKSIKKQVGAMVTSDRPWLLVTAAERSSVTIPEGDYMAAVWKFKNFGKTPAFIKRVIGGVDIVGNFQTDLMPIAEFTEPYAGADERILAPNQHTGDIKFKMARIMPNDEFHALTKSEKFLLLYGQIEYSDTFDGNLLHISRFCYRYTFGQRDGFYFECGGAEYNKYT